MSSWSSAAEQPALPSPEQASPHVCCLAGGKGGRLVAPSSLLPPRAGEGIHSPTPTPSDSLQGSGFFFHLLSPLKSKTDQYCIMMVAIATQTL